MKRILLILLVCSISTLDYSALDFYKDASLHDHMIEVNKEWNKIELDILNIQHHFNSDNERITTHLLLVIRHLRKNTPSHLEYNQVQKRNSLLDELEEYAINSVYPKNILHDFRIPYFLDHENTACAVGYMMRKSGNDHIGQWVKSNMNNAYVAEIPAGALDNWALEFGFTREELAWIQPGYAPPLTGWYAMDEGVNGEVSAFAEFNGKLIIAGEFSDASGLAVNNVVAWDGINYSALGNGVNGKVNVAIVYEGELYLGGFFNGGTNDIAIWDGISWTYQTAFPSKAAEVYEFEVHLDKLYTTGSAQGFAGPSYFIAIWNNSSWNIIKQFSGPVLSMKSHNNDLIAGGGFTGMFTNNELEEVNHIAIYTDGVWSELNGGLNGEVYDVISTLSGDIIAAGEIMKENEFSFGLAFAENNSWSQIISEGWFLSNNIDGNAHFNHVMMVEGDTIVSGDFLSFLDMTNGTNLAKIHTQGNYTGGQPYVAADDEINLTTVYNDNMYIGGEFITLTGVPFNHVARFDFTSSFDVLELDNISIFPNPVFDQLIIDVSKSLLHLERVKMMNTAGQVVLDKIISDQESIIELNFNLPSGTYLLELIANEGFARKKMVVIN